MAGAPPHGGYLGRAAGQEACSGCRGRLQRQRLTSSTGSGRRLGGRRSASRLREALDTVPAPCRRLAGLCRCCNGPRRGPALQDARQALGLQDAGRGRSRVPGRSAHHKGLRLPLRPPWYRRRGRGPEPAAEAVCALTDPPGCWGSRRAYAIAGLASYSTKGRMPRKLLRYLCHANHHGRRIAGPHPDPNEIEHQAWRTENRPASIGAVALSGIRGAGFMRPWPPPVGRGGLCRGGGRCARTGRSTGTAAASPARCRGAAGARSAAATRSLPSC